jgi:hypothetical protein
LDKCEPEGRFDLQIKALREYIDLKIQALQSEYSKSEANYPTRQQLNEEMGRLLTKSEAEVKLADLARQIKIIIGFLVGLFMLFVADYLRR